PSLDVLKASRRGFHRCLLRGAGTIEARKREAGGAHSMNSASNRATRERTSRARISKIPKPRESAVRLRHGPSYTAKTDPLCRLQKRGKRWRRASQNNTTDSRIRSRGLLLSCEAQSAEPHERRAGR